MMAGDELELIARWLTHCRSVVAFTGAGISTESGIPDFRSPQGVWATNRQIYFDEYLASAEARYEYWRQKAQAHREFAASRPNAGHQTLAGWEARGLLRSVITQNIDGLHQAAGSRQVYELHGTALWIACLECRARFEAGPLVEQFLATDRVPTCERCGGLLKHATVSFGQALPEDVLRAAIHDAEKSDLFFAIGSSLVVEPAASLPRAAKRCGARLVIINRDPTPLDRVADILVRDPIGAALSSIDDWLEPAE